MPVHTGEMLGGAPVRSGGKGKGEEGSLRGSCHCQEIDGILTRLLGRLEQR